MTITAVTAVPVSSAPPEPVVKVAASVAPPKPGAALTPNPQITFDSKLHQVVLEFRNEAGVVTRYPDAAKAAPTSGGVDSTA